jgi:hypothetical protein
VAPVRKEVAEKLTLGPLPKEGKLPRILTEHGALGAAHTNPDFYVRTLTPVSRSFGTYEQLLVVYADDSALRASIVVQSRSESVRSDTSPERLKKAAALVNSVAFVFSADTSVRRVAEVASWFRDSPAEVALGAVVVGDVDPKEERSPDALDGYSGNPPPKGACASAPIQVLQGRKLGEFGDGRDTIIERISKEAAERCGAMTPDGGALMVDLRIGKKGVEEACIERDFVDSADVRECALKTVAAFQYPPVVGGDYVNYAHTIGFVPRSKRRVFCD